MNPVDYLDPELPERSTMPDDESLTHRLLEFLCEADNGVIEDEFGDPMQVGIQRGDGDTLDVFINGRDLGGQLVTLARYRVTVERVVGAREGTQ